MGFSATIRRDFEYWSALAKRDPDAFELERERAISDFLQEHAPNKQDRLRKLQWRIDQIRALSKSPLAACAKISDLMMESLYGDRGLLRALEYFESEKDEIPVSAAVIPFRRRTH